MNAHGYYQELIEDAGPDKIKAVKFELTRAEGLTVECGPAAPVATWKAADDILRHWAMTAPDDGCYDKCDFTVTYADGESYTGRYDLKRHDMGFTDLLAHHMRGFVGFLAGTNRPDWMTDDRYNETMERYGEETKNEYANFLDHYEIGNDESANAPVMEVVHDPKPQPLPVEPKREKITDTTLVAKMVREQLKKEFPVCKFSVTSRYFAGGSELTIALMSAPFEVMQDNGSWDSGYAQLNHNVLRHPFDEKAGEQPNCDGWYQVPDGYAVCNGAYITRKGWEVLARAVEIGQAENWDHSDIYTDYFDVNYYFDIQIGKWNRKFEVK